MNEPRRVTVSVLVKADSQADAGAIVTDHMNEWFTDGVLPTVDGYPRGTLLHFTVVPETGHRAVAA